MLIGCWENLIIDNKKGPNGPDSNWWRGEDLNFRPSGYEPDGFHVFFSYYWVGF